jgi:hypothetical protein
MNLREFPSNSLKFPLMSLEILNEYRLLTSPSCKRRIYSTISLNFQHKSLFNHDYSRFRPYFACHLDFIDGYHLANFYGLLYICTSKWKYARKSPTY